MLRRPQRTEDRLRAGGEDGAYHGLVLQRHGWEKHWRPPADSIPRSRRLPRLQYTAATCESSCTPRARASAEAASAGCARGHWLSSPPPSREPQRYAPSSPPARKRSFVRCGRRSILVPSFASPGEVHPKVHCQRSSRRTGQRGLTAGLPPPRAGLPASFTPPWGGATSRRYALGSLLWPHQPRRGQRCAAGCARCTILSMFPARQRGA